MLIRIWGKEHSGYTAGESVNQHNPSRRQSKSVFKKQKETHKTLKCPIISTLKKKDKCAKMYI